LWGRGRKGMMPVLRIRELAQAMQAEIARLEERIADLERRLGDLEWLRGRVSDIESQISELAGCD